MDTINRLIKIIVNKYEKHIEKFFNNKHRKDK